MDDKTIKKEARERSCRAIDLAPPIERFFNTTLGSCEWEADSALMAALENHQQAVLHNGQKEIESLQAEHAQLTQAFEQQMQPHQA